ncbi:MAG: twin-arginine translocase TatA/TatE family subunit [Deltaproteobacteria bacterium]|nr:twin-arginine translocase TatA/TatE family subunit [Deltaproteobacteria bacterium]
MFGLGTSELILILLVVFVIFGAGKLPELGSGLGKAIKNFKRASSETDIDVTPEKDKLDGDKAQKKG